MSSWSITGGSWNNGRGALASGASRAYLLSETDLVVYLKRVLGRPLIAHVTRTADANNVSR
jgi:hypothetical protein